jgi:single-stranded-DNA-specific exonuclease
MLKEVGLRGNITAYHLGFIIGPRINACGRLRHAKEALELFLTSEEKKAKELVLNLSADNQERRSIEGKIYRDAKIIIEENNYTKDRIIIAEKDSWHEGVVGIVASTISEDYYRPSILLALKDNKLKGSARSIPGIDITEVLTTCQKYLSSYGGHSQAAGLELQADKLSQLRTCVNEYAQKFNENIFARKRSFDMQITLDQLTDDVVYFLRYFEPTGMANPQPVFLGTDLEVVGVPRVVGNDHLKFTLRDGKKAIDAIAFNQADKILDIEVGKTKLDCLFSISEDSFTGKKKTMLKIKEMRKSVK